MRAHSRRHPSSPSLLLCELTFARSSSLLLVVDPCTNETRRNTNDASRGAGYCNCYCASEVSKTHNTRHGSLARSLARTHAHRFLTHSLPSIGHQEEPRGSARSHEDGRAVSRGGQHDGQHDGKCDDYRRGGQGYLGLPVLRARLATQPCMLLGCGGRSLRAFPTPRADGSKYAVRCARGSN